MASVIHVEPQPEPPSFDQDVRQKGIAHLQRKAIALHEPLPTGTELAAYWRDCLDDLYSAYQGTCAYLGVFFERTVGGATVDHFVAKSKRPVLAYEWSNFRLACHTMNSRKHDYEDVLDPFEVEDGWFQLELVTGRIYAAPELPEDVRSRVTATIERLGLDDAGNRETRARHFRRYREAPYPAEYLKEYSPFVFLEAQRQGLL